MNKKYELKEVTIGCFTNNVLDNYLSESIRGKHYHIQQIEIDKKTLKDIICVIDEANGNAVDIHTGEYYHILERDKYNRIIEKPNDIISNHYYALKVKENDVKITESFLYRIFLTHSIEQIMDEYHKVLKGKQVMKSLDEKK